MLGFSKLFASFMRDVTMAALNPGTIAPDFKLQNHEGKQFSLREALARGPVISAFFKISCPTCQYALPFLQRIYRRMQMTASPSWVFHKTGERC